DEVRREVQVIFASGDQTEQLKRFCALGDIDIFQSGLVLQDSAGLQITDAGLSLLHSLESSGEPSLEFSSAPLPRPFDSPSSIEERLRTFDFEPRSPGNDAQDGDYDDHHQSAQDEDRRTFPIEVPDPASKIRAFDLPQSAHSTNRERDRKSFELTSLIAFIVAKHHPSSTLGHAILHKKPQRASMA